MTLPFPGMDPYLEHPALWEGVHARLVVAVANQLQPLLDPRYVASVEERVFIEGPQQRIPDVWVQKTTEQKPSAADTAHEMEGGLDTAVVVEVEELEIHQKRVEILDTYNNMKLVSLIEVLSPTNKRPGPGHESYTAKQKQILERDCHLVEVDLLRTGDRVLSIPDWRLEEFQPLDYVVCVNRWPWRNRFEIYPRQLVQRLPRIAVPLAEPDADVRLDIQTAVEQVYVEGRYARRLRYDEPCQPPLDEEDRRWASERLHAFRDADRSRDDGKGMKNGG